MHFYRIIKIQVPSKYLSLIIYSYNNILLILFIIDQFTLKHTCRSVMYIIIAANLINFIYSHNITVASLKQ